MFGRHRRVESQKPPRRTSAPLFNTQTHHTVNVIHFHVSSIYNNQTPSLRDSARTRMLEYLFGTSRPCARRRRRTPCSTAVRCLKLTRNTRNIVIDIQSLPVFDVENPAWRDDACAACLQVEVETQDDDVGTPQLREQPCERVRSVLCAIVGSEHQHQKRRAAADGLDLKVKGNELKPHVPAQVPDRRHLRVRRGAGRGR